MLLEKQVLLVPTVLGKLRQVCLPVLMYKPPGHAFWISVFVAIATNIRGLVIKFYAQARRVQVAQHDLLRAGFLRHQQGNVGDPAALPLEHGVPGRRKIVPEARHRARTGRGLRHWLPYNQASRQRGRVPAKQMPPCFANHYLGLRHCLQRRVLAARGWTGAIICAATAAPNSAATLICDKRARDNVRPLHVERVECDGAQATQHAAQMYQRNANEAWNNSLRRRSYERRDPNPSGHPQRRCQRRLRPGLGRNVGQVATVRSPGERKVDACPRRAGSQPGDVLADVGDGGHGKKEGRGKRGKGLEKHSAVQCNSCDETPPLGVGVEPVVDGAGEEHSAELPESILKDPVESGRSRDGASTEANSVKEGLRREDHGS